MMIFGNNLSRTCSHKALRWFLFALFSAFLTACGSQGTVKEASTKSSSEAIVSEEELAPASAKREIRHISAVMPELNAEVLNNANNITPFTSELCIEGLLSAEKANNRSLLYAIAKRCKLDSLNTADSETYYLVYQRNLEADKLWKESRELLESTSYLQSHIFFDDAAKTYFTLAEARSLEQLGDYWQAARTRATLAGKKVNVDLDTNHFGQDVKIQNDQKLWDDIMQLTHEDIVVHIRSTPRSFLLSWLELAEIIKNPAATNEERISAIKSWQSAWSRNNILGNWYPPINLGELKKAVAKRVNSIGVVLPLSGKLSKAGRAVQSGIIAANLQASTPKDIQFYDSNNQLFDDVYRQARNNGVDVIIGPLEKSRVEQLNTSLTEIPVLALNYIGSALPPTENVIQFGLAAEDEAVQLADYASRAGLKSVLVLYTERDWAQRAANAFSQRWQSVGGNSLKQPLSVEANYQKEIAAALDIADSEQRKQQLQGLMGKRFEFKPRRRQDIDAIVVFSNARQLAAIKPLLAYHYAGDLPVLSSSYANSYSPAQRRDLAGVLLLDIPMLLEKNRFRNQLNRPLRENYQLTRLFAMGVDALRLAPNLAIMTAIQQDRIPALTGELALQNQRLTRTLKPAVISRGQIKIVSDQQFIRSIK